MRTLHHKWVLSEKCPITDSPYFPAFGLMWGNTEQKKLRIWTLFTQ